MIPERLPPGCQVGLVVAAIDLAALSVGVAVFLIVHGALMAFLRLAPYWPASNRLYLRLSGGQVSPLPHLSPLKNGSDRVFFVLRLAVPAVFIAAGVWLLLSAGFCLQNIPCFLGNQGN